MLDPIYIYFIALMLDPIYIYFIATHVRAYLYIYHGNSCKILFYIIIFVTTYVRLYTHLKKLV